MSYSYLVIAVEYGAAGSRRQLAEESEGSEEFLHGGPLSARRRFGAVPRLSRIFPFPCLCLVLPEAHCPSNPPCIQPLSSLTPN